MAATWIWGLMDDIDSHRTWVEGERNVKTFRPPCFKAFVLIRVESGFQSVINLMLRKVEWPVCQPVLCQFKIR